LKFDSYIDDNFRVWLFFFQFVSNTFVIWFINLSNTFL
jgi:hypothetical protein